MNAYPAILGPLDIRPEDFEWARFGRMAEGRPWQGRTVVITGGTGFIGARLARKLALYGASVTIPTRDKSRAGARIDPNIRLVAWNPADPASVAAAFAEADTLFNLAYDVRRSGEANMALYRGIADAAASAGVRRFIHASSIAVYDGWPTEDLDENSPSDGPGHAYKMAKRAMERDLEARVGRGDFDAAIIQPVNVYGPFSAMWTDAIAERIRAGGLVLPKGFDGLNNGVYVDDLVDAFIAAGDLAHVARAAFHRRGSGTNSLDRDVRRLRGRLRPDGRARGLAARSGGAGTFAGHRAIACHAGECASREPHRDVAGQGAACAAQRLSRGARGGPYRPVQEDPRFYLSRSVVHADRAATELCPPVVDAAEGLARTKAYIGWRFGVKN